MKQGPKKILQVFYKNQNTPVHVRELARETGLQGQSIMRYLNLLEKDRILIAKKDGNLKKYCLRNNDKVISVLSVFDIEKYNKLPLLKRQALEYFISRLKEQPVIIILFGSTAKESYGETSDIDILMVVNSKIDTMDARNFVDGQTGEIINDLQISYKDFLQELKMKKDMVINSAIETGYPLTNHLIFYRCIKDEGL